jgi:hypothetical protein
MDCPAKRISRALRQFYLPATGAASIYDSITLKNPFVVSILIHPAQDIRTILGYGN